MGEREGRVCERGDGECGREVGEKDRGEREGRVYERGECERVRGEYAREKERGG